jgi:uncharacterized protein (DUF302 family)
MDASDPITRESPVGPKATMDRLVAAVEARGMSVFARIDHAAGAARSGMPLRPTEVLIFGDPRAGTPLMQARQTIGLELPLRALVWQDEAGATQVSWHPPDELARRLGLPAALKARSEAMETAVAAAVAEATEPLREDERLDEALEESFPASDPPAL